MGMIAEARGRERMHGRLFLVLAYVEDMCPWAGRSQGVYSSRSILFLSARTGGRTRWPFTILLSTLAD